LAVSSYTPFLGFDQGDAMVRLTLLVLACVFVCGVVRADTIYMLDTDRKIVGVVHRETEDFIIVLLKGDKGQIKIYRNKIKSIEYDIKTQLDKLAEDDYAGRYKVGVWAMEKGKFADAIDLFETLKGKEGVGPDMLKLLGQAYEQRKQLDKALENYTDYLKANPEDQQIAARVAELNKEVNPTGTAAPGKQITEGIEATGNWVGEQWAFPCKAQITAEPTTGNKVVTVQTKGGDKDKTAFTRHGDLNLSDRTEMQLKIFLNCPTPVNVAVAFVNSKNEFLESKQVRIAPNSWVPLSVKLDAQEFKAERTGWTHKLPLEGKERVSRVHILVYGQRPFTLYADGIYFK
jgi:tetratricopeptide (TPR) repeat protein